jgi:hypothetical protein
MRDELRDVSRSRSPLVVYRVRLDPSRQCAATSRQSIASGQSNIKSYCQTFPLQKLVLVFNFPITHEGLHPIAFVGQAHAKRPVVGFSLCVTTAFICVFVSFFSPHNVTPRVSAGKCGLLKL